MPTNPPLDLGRRERQIMEVAYRLGRATASEIRNQLPDPPSNSSVRGMLRLLEEKGHLKHEQDGFRYIYFPVTPRDDIGASTMRHVLKTFFAGSATAAMAALLDAMEERPSEEQFDALAAMIEQAREEGQ